MTRTIENSFLKISVSDHGAELTGIYDKTNDREILWQADPAYWKRHAPVLFPNVGRNYKDIWRLNTALQGTAILSARISPILPFPLSLSPLKKP